MDKKINQKMFGGVKPNLDQKPEMKLDGMGEVKVVSDTPASSLSPAPTDAHLKVGVKDLGGQIPLKG